MPPRRRGVRFNCEASQSSVEGRDRSETRVFFIRESDYLMRKLKYDINLCLLSNFHE